jgi:hypothetical protein
LTKFRREIRDEEDVGLQREAEEGEEQGQEEEGAHGMGMGWQPTDALLYPTPPVCRGLGVENSGYCTRDR